MSCAAWWWRWGGGEVGCAAAVVLSALRLGVKCTARHGFVRSRCWYICVYICGYMYARHPRWLDALKALCVLLAGAGL